MFGFSNQSFRFQFEVTESDKMLVFGTDFSIIIFCRHPIHFVWISINAHTQSCGLYKWNTFHFIFKMPESNERKLAKSSYVTFLFLTSNKFHCVHRMFDLMIWWGWNGEAITQKRIFDKIHLTLKTQFYSVFMFGSHVYFYNITNLSFFV